MQKSRSSPVSTDLDTGARIGRYVVLEHVGSGAMGVVYSAYDPELDRRIAVKLLKAGGAGASETARGRLVREAKAMARLSHPNVIAVHDVGLFDEQVFLAMEFMAGGTLKGWLAAKGRNWREILDVFIAAGRGLAAAHAAGLVHRDFKPDNVLLDKEGRPRVVDFGLARDAAGGPEDGAETLTDSQDVVLATPGGTATQGGAHLQTLTRTGALTGTPAYMAPEQFLGERADERSDQFSFCVALYEALYGERPFAGEDLISLSVTVTEGQIRPMPKDRGVPAWIRRVVVRGLRPNAGERWASMEALIGALEDDPAVKRRRRLIAGGAVGAVVISLLVARQMVMRKRQEVDREIARHVDAATKSAVAANSKAKEARDLRLRAWNAFDAMDREQGEVLWRQTRALVPEIESTFDRAETAFGSALVLDTERDEVRAQLLDVLFDHLLFAEDFRLDAKTAALSARVAANDSGGTKRKVLSATGSVSLRVKPTPSEPASLERYEREASTGRRRTVADGSITASGDERSLAQGSYRVTVKTAGGATVFYPFQIGRGQRLVIDLKLPSPSQVPAGFAYVPAGEFLVGDADEQLRTQFLDTVPLHRRRTEAYLIARNETTYAEWIAFLNALPAGERERHAPDASTVARGSLRLREDEGTWKLTFQPSAHRYSARAGEPIVYVGRKQRERQDWLRFPVAGISPADGERYFAWLRSTRQVPGARFCTEVEWERAARGSDDRIYPHGDELRVDDANFDVTYGRVPTAYGPDVVGSFAASRSPFGIDDMVGNAMEFAVSSQKKGELALRGGAYYFASASCRSTNREPVPATFRDVTTGLRVCASVEGGP